MFFDQNIKGINHLNLSAFDFTFYRRTTSRSKQSSQQICETHQQKESITKLARGKIGSFDVVNLHLENSINILTTELCYQKLLYSIPY